MSNKIEHTVIAGIVIFLLIFGFGVASCDRLTKQESVTYYGKEEKRESEYMQDCLKSLPKHECLYRWQTAIRPSGK